MTAFFRRWTTGISVLACVAAAGCGSESDTASTAAPGGMTAPAGAASGGGNSLTGAGATFPYPLYSKWFDAYHQAHPEVTINYQSIGSGGGIQQLKERTVDFGASDAPLSDAELKEMPGPVAQIPTTAGAVVLAYNLPSLTQPLKLTPEAAAGIFLGTIKSWNDPAISAANAGVALPATPVSVAHRSDGSGTSYLFTNYLADVSAEWKSKVGAGKSVEWPVGLGGKGNDGVTSLVKQTEGAIGYVELVYALQNELKYAWVKNKAGEFVEPKVESITAAVESAAGALAQDVRAPVTNAPGKAAYPIAGLTYLLVYRKGEDSGKAQTIKSLLEWCLKEGQKEAAALHYAPLPEAVVALNNKQLQSLQ